MTDDITNDLSLLDDWLAGKGYGEEAGLCMRAMDLIRKQADEIEKLRAERDKFYYEYRMVCDEECKIVHEENEKLRAALKPFAATAEWDVSGTEHDDDLFRLIPPPYNRAPVLRVIHLRAAKAALGESDDIR